MLRLHGGVGVHLRGGHHGLRPGRRILERKPWETPEAEARLLKFILYKKMGEPKDMGEAAAWLSSDMTDYLKGTTLFVDGEMTIFPGFARDKGEVGSKTTCYNRTILG